MHPRFVARLGPADAATAGNALVGFLAVAAAPVDLALAARLLLVAAIADGLDGVLARRGGDTPLGEYLDSLADVASFGVAPAVFVLEAARAEWGFGLGSMRPVAVASVAIPALFVVLAVIRLGLYTAYDLDSGSTEGVQTTLAATVLAVAYLAGIESAAVLVAAMAVFTVLMVVPVRYPDLAVRDALVMGVVQGFAIMLPRAFSRLFPRVLLIAALAYLLLGPWLYRRGGGSGVASREGKRS